jgi:hypothetical protein
MRKLVWFVIFLLITITAISFACAMSPPFSATLYHYGVEIVGVTIVQKLTWAVTSGLAWGTTSLATATLVIVTVGVSFTIFFLALKHYLWDKPVMNAAKSKLGLGNTVSTKQMTMQREPAEPETQPQKKEETVPQT